MIIHLLFLGLSLLLLIGGAESLVRGSSSLALRLGLSKLMVGLTIVAFGTSSPELFVSLKAALVGQGDIALGNVVGSNIFNIGLILGLTALVCPIPVHFQVIKIDAPIALLTAIILSALLLDFHLGRIEGFLFFAGLIAYVWMNVILARRETKANQILEVEGEVPDKPSKHWVLDMVLILAGLGILVLGSRLLVEHAVLLAQSLGVSEAIIGLTIIAAGTSMPELATSLVAAFRKQPDIAIGNVVGSNIFNILGILGISSLVVPLSAPGISAFDLGTMILFSVLLLPLLYTGRILHRFEGALLLALYGAYVFFLWPK